MIPVWGLPKTATIGGVEYAINTDFRDILEIISYLNDNGKPLYLRWQIALGLFFDEEIPIACQTEAMEYLSEFISYGETDTRPGPKLMDWDQDAKIIIGDVNKVAGREVRETQYLHWWTFLSYFYGIGEGQLSTIVSIREKKSSGKKLEKWEEEFYKKNRSKIDFRRPQTEEDAAVQEYFKKWL
jgi:hypothetical protein